MPIWSSRSARLSCSTPLTDWSPADLEPLRAPERQTSLSLTTRILSGMWVLALVLACVFAGVSYQLHEWTSNASSTWALSFLVLLLVLVGLMAGLRVFLKNALRPIEQGIETQMARTRAIVSTAADAIIGLDAQGNVVITNPATSSLFGVPEEDLLGFPLEQIVPGLSIDFIKEQFGTEHHEGRLRRIVRHDFFGTRVDGTLFPVELSHNMVYANEALIALTGRTIYQLLGFGLEVLGLDASSGPGYFELQNALQKGKNCNVTLNLSMNGQAVKNIELSLSPVRNASGALTNFIGIVSDITSRVLAENATAERTAQLDAILGLSPDGLVLFDADNRLMFANPAFQKMTGLKWSRLDAPMSMDNFDYLMGNLCDSNAPWAALAANVSGVVNNSDNSTHSESGKFHLVRPQPRVIQTELRRNYAGRGETILYLRDVTREDEVDRMKSDFLASAAHELRTPMVSILGFSELLIKRNYSPERQKDMLATIHRQSGLLVKMINELLDLARIESRRGLDMNIIPTPLAELVNQCVKGMMLAEGERQVHVLRLAQVQVLADPEKMELALKNILGNAFKYSPNGGHVNLETDLLDHQGRRYAVVHVQDHGIGMTPEQLEKAFERFYRADTSGKIPGTGLGLSLVKEIADLHQGRVEMSSEFGKGTRVSLWIPLSA
ncbi:MAG: PAS domain S-box protein [Betaproteobacteria bacterium]|nr:PAS domain S-box protein [Betaproteobacteria bacterium]